MVAPTVNDPTRELGYQLKRGGAYASLKYVAHGVGEVAKDSSTEIATWISQTVQSTIGQLVGPDLATNLGAFGGMVGKGAAGVATIGLLAALSAGLTQMDYNHKKDSLKELYKEELAARLGKPAGKVTVADLENFGKENKTIDEVLKRNRKQRNFSVGMSFLASLTALAVVSFVLTPMVLIPLGLAAAPGAVAIGIGAKIGGIALTMATSLLTYNLVKEPLHAIANHLFDLDDKVTHDHIDMMQKIRLAGKSVSREEVLSAFVTANPQLDTYIVAEYGRHFDDLNPTDKKRATEELNTMIPLDKLTLDINSGRVNPTELAFAVEGKISGVNHEITAHDKESPAQEPGKIRSAVNRVGKVISMLRRRRPGEISDVYVEDINHVVQASAQVEVSHEHSKPAQGFVKNLSLAKHDPDLSHVEQVDQGRLDASLNLAQPT